jgi:biopolymer transport protein ExbD
MFSRKIEAETVSGLRTRYIPKSRIGHGFISFAPWLDIVLIGLFFVLIHGNFVVAPGVLIDLPTMLNRGGAAVGLSVVVLSLETETGGVREELVVFDDEPFRVEDPAQMEAFQKSLKAKVSLHAHAPLLILADRRVAHGTLMRLYEISREAGVGVVNLAAGEPVAAVEKSE